MRSGIPRDLVQASVIFLCFILFFAILSFLVDWPNSANGWPIAILISAIAAVLPIAPQYLSSLGKNIASFEGFGLKINFADVVSESKVAVSTALLVQQAVASPEPTSGLGELEKAAQEASKATVFTIDLKQGREWYWSRLFALAGMAVLVGRPKYIVLLAQRGAKPRQVLGCIEPDNVMTAYKQLDIRYAEAWDRGMLELRQAKVGANQYAHTYQEIGDLVIMRILVDYMKYPNKFGVASAPIEQDPPTASTWITGIDAENIFDPWLVRRTVELTAPDRDRIKSALSTDLDIVVATRSGTYDGVVDVTRLERQVLQQLVS